MKTVDFPMHGKLRLRTNHKDSSMSSILKVLQVTDFHSLAGKRVYAHRDRHVRTAHCSRVGSWLEGANVADDERVARFRLPYKTGTCV